MSLVRANGITLHVQEVAPAAVTRPVPPTAVLIHGMASDSMASWYLSLAYPLAEAGMRVLLYDLRGHGRSERPVRGYAFDDFLDDLDALLAVRGVTGPVHLFGNSFGGTVAFGYAARHPERVAAIVAVESALPTAAWFARISRRFAQAKSLLAAPDFANGRGPLFARRVRETVDLLDTTTLARELPTSPLPDADRIAAIGCPILCLYGGDSLLHQLAPELLRLLPHAHTVVLPGQRHTLLVDDPHRVREHVLPWLAGNGGVAPAPPAEVTVSTGGKP